MAKAQRIREIKVPVGEYTDQSGQKRTRWETIGSLWAGDKNDFIVLKKTFNPAGLESSPNNKHTVLLNCFDIEEKTQQPQAQAQPRAQVAQAQVAQQAYAPVNPQPNPQPVNKPAPAPAPAPAKAEEECYF